MKKSIAYVLIGGMVVGAISALFLDIFGHFFVNEHESKEYEDRLVTKFIVETRLSWNHICKGFYNSRQRVYISREAEIEEEETLNRELTKLNELKSDLDKVTSNLTDDKQAKMAHNVLILISNATDELKRAIKTEDFETSEKFIENANKEIDLANAQFLKVAQENGYDIEPLAHVRKELNE